MSHLVHIVGGGLAGTEAALLLADAGADVVLHEQKPERRSPAHKEDGLAELVCSNSLRSDNPHNAIGLLHEELRRLGSPVLLQADRARVPAGDALAVDRVAFSGGLTARVREHPLIELVGEEARYFEGCLPIEVMAERGRDSLAFGPMKPVGLVDPRSGARPHAVVQLRREDKAGTAWNLVGFQTRLTWPEQKRIFASCIPGLQ